MKYVLEFEASTDKAALRAADCARTADDGLRITRLTNASYPDSTGHVLIGIDQRPVDTPPSPYAEKNDVLAKRLRLIAETISEGRIGYKDAVPYLEAAAKALDETIPSEDAALGKEVPDDDEINLRCIAYGQPRGGDNASHDFAQGAYWMRAQWLRTLQVAVGDVYDEVRAERRHQDEKWGGEAHDDGHGAGDWLDIIDRLMAEYDHGEDARKILVQIAAVAVAGIETRDRAAQRG